jgi:hypothetical protein
MEVIISFTWDALIIIAVAMAVYCLPIRFLWEKNKAPR